MAELSALRRSIAALFGATIDPTVGVSAQGVEARPADHGLLAWSVPIDVARDSSLMSAIGAGILIGTRMRRVPAGPITNLHVFAAVAGATLSNCFAAAFTDAGVLIGQTADQSTAWQSGGYKTMPLVGGPFSFAGGDLNVGIWYNGTTAPTLIRSGSGAGGSGTVGQVAGGFNAFSSNSGLTTTAPASLGTKSLSAIRFWTGVS